MNIYEVLNKLNINYDEVEHEAVYTIEDAQNLDIADKIEGIGCKNLFLKDSRGKFFLAILPEDKKMRINEIAKIANATHMSFGKEDELMELLKLTRGCVSPFGIINDVNNVVTLVIDSELKGNKLLFHPNRNTATVSVHFDDLEKFIKSENHNYILM